VRRYGDHGLVAPGDGCALPVPHSSRIRGDIASRSVACCEGANFTCGVAPPIAGFSGQQQVGDRTAEVDGSSGTVSDGLLGCDGHARLLHRGIVTSNETCDPAILVVRSAPSHNTSEIEG